MMSADATPPDQPAALEERKWLAHERECEQAAMAVLKERMRKRATTPIRPGYQRVCVKQLSRM